jgi:hypothetical protein
VVDLISKRPHAKACGLLLFLIVFVLFRPDGAAVVSTNCWYEGGNMSLYCAKREAYVEKIGRKHSCGLCLLACPVGSV